MRHRRITFAPAEPAPAGYVFFAHALDEMLFDYTLDTYKPSTHNASTLVLEVLAVLKDIGSELIEQTHFDEVLAELKWMIGSDPVAKSLINIDHEHLLAGLSSKEQQVAKARLSLLATSLGAKHYVAACSKRLLEIIPEGREKKEIRATARSLLTSLLRRGYARRFVRKRCNELFFSESALPLSERLQSFFNAFDLEPKTYRLCCRGAALFLEIQQTLSDFSWSWSNSTPAFLHASLINGLDDKFPVFLWRDFDALDPFAARKNCDDLLDRISNLFSMFHHKQTLLWGTKAWVSEPFDKAKKEIPEKGTIIGRPVAPMTRVLDALPRKAAQRMHHAFSELRMDMEGFDQFYRVVALHGAAIKSSDSSVQLLNLWSALEALVPDCVKGSTVRNVTNSLMPFLLLVYPRTIFDDLWFDIFKWNRERAAYYFGNASKSKEEGRVALLRMLLLPSESDRKDALFAELEQYALLLNRCHTVMERFRSPDNLVKTLDEHQRKVTWQIRRIYRTRNLYVHAGRSVRMLDTLIENAHCYLDAYLSSVFDMAREAPRPLNPEQGWVLANERLRSWRERIKRSGSFDADNLVGLVLNPR